MKINNLMIDGVGGIRNLELSFNDGFNVICGANGVGKTTILNTVADAFSDSGELLKRNSMVAEGKYCIWDDELEESFQKMQEGGHP